MRRLPTDEILVRPLSVAELPLLLALFPYDDPQQAIAGYARELESRESDVFGLFAGSALLGELHARYADTDPLVAITGKRAYLFAYRVRKERQGCGLGQRLLQDTLDALGARGYTEFTIGVEDGNAPAKHIYAQYGFDRVIARKSERYHDVSYEYDLLLKA